MNMSKPRFFVLCLSVLMLGMVWAVSRAQGPNAAANTANPQPPAGSNFFKFDPAIDTILDAGAKLEMLKAEGFEGREGPTCVPDGPAGCMEGGENSPLKELSFHGFYFVKDGKVQLLDMDPGGAPPNGIALSPDQKTLYVTNAPAKRQIFAYQVQADDTAAKNPRVLIDLTGEQGLGGPDGVRVDRKGNVYAAA